VNNEETKYDAWVAWKIMKETVFNTQLNVDLNCLERFESAHESLKNEMKRWMYLVGMNPKLGTDTVDEMWLNQFVEDIKARRTTIADLESEKWQYAPDAQLEIDAAIQEIRDYNKQKEEERAMKEQATEEISTK
jgi:hypothetical protein